MKLWKILVLIGAPVVFTSAYMLHDAIWPGEGIFVNLFAGASYRGSESGDFSEIKSQEYVLTYYIPIVLGALMCLIGWWLHRTQKLPPHVLYTEMTDDNE